jgi:hypothetical protein
MTVDKHLLQAVGALMLLDPMGTSGHLDEVGKGHLSDARDVLLSHPPRVVVEAFVTWNRTGRRTHDPRPLAVTDTGERTAPRYRGGSRSSLSS